MISNRSLTEGDFLAAAYRLSTDPAKIRALAKVESGGRSGFASDGHPARLFEAHKFSKYTGGIYDKSHPALSSPTWNRKLYAKDQPAEWVRYQAAFNLDPEDAMRATSWGMFQIMGENWRAAGFETVQEYVTAMGEDEGEQLEAFVSFIQTNHLRDALDRISTDPETCRAIARGYNGTQYAQNNYHVKIAQAFVDVASKQSNMVWPEAATTRLLRIGMRGEDVKTLQRYLGLPQDGIFGPMTRIAVEIVQEQHKLVVDGVVGVHTRNALDH